MSALRRQILPLLLIEAVIDSIEKNAVDTDAARGPLEMVRSALNLCHAQLKFYNIARLKVDGQLTAFQGVVKEAWVDEHVSTGEIVSACVDLAAEVAAQAPPMKVAAWEALESALFMLYELIDPDLTDEKAIHRGSAIGAKFKGVCW